MNPTVLLFDLDQTLLASRSKRLKLAFIFQALNSLQKRGFNFFESLIFLNAMEKSMHAGDPHVTNADRIAKLLRARFSNLSESEARNWVGTWIEEVFSQLLTHFLPMPEHESLFHELRELKSFQLVLATNPIWPKKIVEMRMQRGTLKSEHFTWITHADEMHYAKPDLRYYQEILDKLKVKSEDCLMIGDSFKKDAPAAQLGISVFILREKSKVISPLVRQGPFSELKTILLTQRGPHS